MEGTIQKNNMRDYRFSGAAFPCLSVASVPEGKKRILRACGGKTKKAPPELSEGASTKTATT
ncbi:hypothetical protein, partial [Bacteroides sp.]|uniref:hypothetical protein n=1 Tax=Bacteroides sp. TaxID=29523 RepID=UPI00258632B0